MTINESVLDPIRKNRSTELFSAPTINRPTIKEEIRQFILNLANKFVDETQIPDLKITEMFMIGSMLGYQYNETSDIDIDMRLNIKKSEFNKWLIVPKLCYIPNTQHPINFFLLFTDDKPYNYDNCENAYDILNNSRIKFSDKVSKEIPYLYVRGISEFIIDGISLQLERTRRDLSDLQKYIKLNPETTEISEKERDDAISNKINELIIDKDSINLAHNMLFRLNNDGFENKPISISIEYTAEDKRYSMNNLIYKYLDEFKYYEKMTNLIKEIDSSITQAKSEIKKNIATSTSEDTNKIETQKAVQETFMFKDIDGKFYEY